MCQTWHAGNEGASVHYQVIALHFRFGVYSSCVQATGRSGRVKLLLTEQRNVWRCGPSREHEVESCDRCHVLLSTGPHSWPRGAKGAGEGPGRRETCGHHGLCAGMEGTEPCPSSSSSTTKTFSLTLSKASGTRAKRFYLDG